MVNTVIFAFLLAARAYWTEGSYHQPALTVITSTAG
jgi:hypothetical protein